MPNRRYSTYINVLNALLEYKPEIKPDKIIIDFESAFIKAVHDIFPNATVSGCNFHLNQCLYRNVQNDGLAVLYNTDINFSTGIRMLAALAFVPCDDVDFAFDMLLKSKFFVDNLAVLNTFLSYFKNTWLGVVNARGKRKALFELKLWNCYERVVNNDSRTNNSVEGWHSSFNTLFSSAHSSMGEFINCLKDEQSQTEIFLAQIDVQRDISPYKKRRYAEVDNRLVKIVMSYDKNNIIPYLRAVALNIKM
ncbi:uncharacterized protein LOC122850365 [Aphidius gifuensis]|uniref:uncharacterized protein LOC122850365 n=1 Tax=Aphidius gifuensis TaxID=684658 RepID=UPI001CDC8963|nr:uncharacterized protein LOC122850365 [Aphidius gifuensis]